MIIQKFLIWIHMFNKKKKKKMIELRFVSI